MEKVDVEDEGSRWREESVEGFIWEWEEVSGERYCRPKAAATALEGAMTDDAGFQRRERTGEWDCLSEWEGVSDMEGRRYAAAAAVRGTLGLHTEVQLRIGMIGGAQIGHSLE